MANETNIAGLGVVWMHTDGTFGGFIRSGGCKHQLVGRSANGVLTLTGARHRLEYRKVEQTSERAPVGRGELLDTETGVVTPIVAYANRSEKTGRLTHGISVGGSSEPGADIVW